MKHILCVMAALFLAMPASAQFIGHPEFADGDCPRDDQQVLLFDFGYIDSRGGSWQAAAGNCTDGASIPGWAQPLVGEPFAADVINAAIIHDHYCDRRVHPWPHTHWVFYDALRASGMSRGKAMTLYFAVLAGGPKWIRLIEGQPCSMAALGTVCIMDVGSARPPHDASRIVGFGPVRMALRDAIYDTPAFSQAFGEVGAELDARTDLDGLTDEQEEALLSELRRRAEAVIGPQSAFVRYAEHPMRVAPSAVPVFHE